MTRQKPQRGAERARSKDAVEYRRLYKTAAWKAIRPVILARDLYTCQRCNTPLTPGRSRPTDAVVNHKQPHRGDWTLFTDPDNLEAVCKQCHDSAIQSMERGNVQQIGPDGWPVDSAPLHYAIPFGTMPAARPVTLVFGRPASGKTTYVNANKAPGDEVIDLDDIKQAMFGDRYTDDWSKVKQALDHRDQLIRGLSQSHTGDHTPGMTWVILTGSSPHERAAWKATLGANAKAVTLHEAPEVCIERVLADPNRKPVAEKMMKAIHDWR